MRIPFIPKVGSQNELGVETSRLQFTADTRGGSAFLIAGAGFWLIGAVVSQFVPMIRVEWVLYAGFAVPVAAFVVAKLQGAHLGGNPMYASLVGFATVTELAILPVLFYLRVDHPEVLPAVFLIADGAHLFILMWLHMDYTYFLAGFAKGVLGCLFLFGLVWEGSYPLQMLAGGVISLVAAVNVWRDSQTTLELYLTPKCDEEA